MRFRGLMALLLLLLATSGYVRAEEPLLLSEDAGGILELEGENRIEIVGFTGSVRVRQGKAGELRYAARRLDDRKVDHPLALWVEDRLLRIMPLEGQADSPVFLEVSVGPDLQPSVELSDSTLQVAGLYGNVDVKGSNLQLTARMIDGSLNLELSKSRLSVANVTEGLSLTGSEITAELEQLHGPVTIDIEGGALGLFSIHDASDVTLERADLTAHTLIGEIRLEAEEGVISLTDLRGGAELRLSEASLQMAGTKGSIRVDTDAELRFNGHEGSLTVRSRGALVHGGQAKGGNLDIEASSAEVRLEECEGLTAVRGDDLNVHVMKSKDDLTISTTYSTVLVEAPEKAVTIENEFGDVEVREAAQPVKVSSRDGDVRLIDSKGRVEVKADGPAVEVGWAALTGDVASTIENERGDVTVHIPPGVRCRVEAHAPHGRIESELADLQVSDDGHRTAGVLLGGKSAAPYVKKPTIRVTSGGDLYLMSSVSGDPELPED